MRQSDPTKEGKHRMNPGNPRPQLTQTLLNGLVNSPPDPERKEIQMERYVAGRWDDNSFNIYDRENGNKAVCSPWGFMTLSEAQEAARKLNEENDAAA